MAKQEEQKQKTTVTSIRPTDTGEDGTETQLKTQDLKEATEETAEETTEKTTAEKDSSLATGPAPINRRQLLIGSIGAAATVLAMGTWIWVEASHQGKTGKSGTLSGTQQQADPLVVLWNNTTLQAIRNVRPSIPVSARALAIVHTSMYDAWAAYDPTALSTRSGSRLRQPDSAHTLENKSEAISFAAFRALVDLFPTERAYFSLMMNTLNYDPANHSTNPNTPAGVGNLSAQAVLDFRHRDDSNQLGDLNPGPYSDYTRYRPVNTPQHLKDPNHWQPQLVVNAKGQTGSTAQRFENAQWANVTPFALTSTNLLAGRGLAHYPGAGYTEQAQQVLHYSAELTDAQKVSAEYWLNGPNREQPSGHWCLFAQFISARDKNSLDQNIKLFFALTNAALDTSIACWAAKREYDSPYPLTAIHYLFNGKQVQAWGGPSKGGQMINGSYWQPYRPANLLAPPFPEYCAENSAFSAAAAEILRSFTNSDRLGMSYTQAAHSSMVEPNNPVSNLTLKWDTISQAADDAGLSGLYSGTHFPRSDQDGRRLGAKVGTSVWLAAQSHINGRR
jgi:hypothetical protein